MSASAAAPASTLRLRLATAAVGLPILLLIVWVGGWPFAAACGGVALLATIEFLHGWTMPREPLAAAARRYWLPAAVLGATVGLAALGHAPAAAAGGLALGAAAAGRLRRRHDALAFAGAAAYLGILGATFVWVRNEPNGREWTILGLLATFTTDTGAYAVGRLWGRHLLAPRISPKKTWEGAVGGYTGGFVAVLVLDRWLGTDVGLPTILHLGVALPVAAMAGDLFESWMKRRMGVKDASGLLPGHGGFLDRLDSLIFVFPVLYLFLLLRVGDAGTP